MREETSKQRKLRLFLCVLSILLGLSLPLMGIIAYCSFPTLKAGPSVTMVMDSHKVQRSQYMFLHVIPIGPVRYTEICTYISTDGQFTHKETAEIDETTYRRLTSPVQYGGGLVKTYATFESPNGYSRFGPLELSPEEFTAQQKDVLFRNMLIQAGFGAFLTVCGVVLMASALRGRIFPA